MSYYMDSLVEGEAASARFISHESWKDSIPKSLPESFPSRDHDRPVQYSQFCRALTGIKGGLVPLDGRFNGKFWERGYTHDAGVLIVHGDRHTFPDGTQYLEIIASTSESVEKFVRGIGLAQSMPV